LALVRIVSGAVLIGFGLSKFTQHAREASSFGRYGLPDPSAFAYTIGVVEVGFGALLVLGLATRVAALVLAGNTVGAIATGGRVDGGYVNLGLAPVLLVVMLAIVWLGAGAWSIDAWRRAPRSRRPVTHRARPRRKKECRATGN
jgi:putative oxidoreductase